MLSQQSLVVYTFNLKRDRNDKEIMADVTSIQARIRDALEALVDIRSQLKEVDGPSSEAQETCARIDGLESVLKPLNTGLDTLKSPKDFVKIWNTPAEIALSGVERTINTLNSMLKANKSSVLNFWSKPKWPLSAGNNTILQIQLQSMTEVLCKAHFACMEYVSSPQDICTVSILLDSVNLTKTRINQHDTEELGKSKDDSFCETASIAPSTLSTCTTAFSIASDTTLVPSNSTFQYTMPTQSTINTNSVSTRQTLLQRLDFNQRFARRPPPSSSSSTPLLPYY